VGYVNTDNTRTKLAEYDSMADANNRLDAERINKAGDTNIKEFFYAERVGEDDEDYAPFAYRLPID